MYFYRLILKGAKKTREFVVNQILSRSVDIQQHIDMFVKMKQPRMLLNNIASKLSQPKPVSRLLKESGRASVAPVFIVGMYVDSQKIGEGYGSSIAMAETRVWFYIM
jgi:large subunit ribosomal protein L44